MSEPSDTRRQRDFEEEGRIPDCLRDPFGLLRRRWLPMLLVVVASLPVVYFGVQRMIRPSFQASATVLVSSREIEADLVPAALKEGAFEKISAMVGETLSQDELSALIEKHGLYAGLRQTMSMDELTSMMRRSIGIRAEDSVGPQPFYETARVFRVSFRHGDPNVAAAVANDLAESFAGAGVRLRKERIRLARDVLVEQMEQAQARLDEREKTLDAFRNGHRSELSGDPASLEKGITELRSRLNAQLSRYTALHPETQTLQDEIDGMSRSLERARDARMRLMDYERRVKLEEDRLLDAERKVEEAELAERIETAGEEGLASLLDRAQPPTRPERTPGKFLMVGAVGCLGLAGLLGIFLEYRDPVVLGPDQLENEFDLRVLGGVARIR